MSSRALLLFVLSVFVCTSSAFPEQGKWEFHVEERRFHKVVIPKSLFQGTQIFINIACNSGVTHTRLNIDWSLAELSCWNEYLHFGTEASDKIQPFFDNLTIHLRTTDAECTHVIPLEEYPQSHGTRVESQKVGTSKEEKVDSRAPEGKRIKREEAMLKDSVVGVSDQKEVTEPMNNPKKVPSHEGNRVYVIKADGMYLLSISIDSKPAIPFNLTIEVKMLGPHGYLSAVDWPLLPFYGAMCLVYVILGLAWLIVSFSQWRDLLRIQFWIGGVILLGMLEKATFYAEYQSINSTGQSVRGAVFLAELVSCGKRMLARMLVIIVSLGFGIVKPRLGPMLHRVVFTGILYFILAAVESYLRVMHQKNDPSNQILVASIPLAVLDSAICWWIFTSLVQTTRTLRVRRNEVKLSLYRHFTNTLIFSVVSSVVFMLYSIRYHRLATCLTDWKELWVEDAYWHLLFSVLLLVIMVLWRPTNNNQRYAFTPLLDAPEDEEEEDEQFVNDAFGVKMRGNRSNSPKPKSTNNVEDDLKWVEENIPSSMADTALPILDSEDEIMTTKFEVSKMQ